MTNTLGNCTSCAPMEEEAVAEDHDPDGGEREQVLQDRL